MAFSEWSVNFDGSDEYADAGDSYNFDRTDVFSISYWVRAGAAGTSEFAIAKGAAPSPEGWWSLIRTDGKIVFGMVNTFTTDDLRVRADNVDVRDGFWHHVTITHDGTGTAAGVNHIVDGVLATAVAESNTLTGTISNSATLRFATRENGYPSESLAGNLDEVAFYDKELSLAEVQAIFNTGVPNDLSLLPTATNLVAWWRMGDGDTFPTLINQIVGRASYPIIPDESGSGNDGTMTNMSAASINDVVPTSNFTQYSLVFDGSAEYLNFGDVVQLEYTDSFSWSFWLLPSSLVNGSVINKGAGFAGDYRGYEVGTLVGGEIWFALYSTGASANALVIATSTTPMVVGAWVHVLVTYDGSATPAGVKVYANGVLQAMAAPISDTLSATVLNSADLHFMNRSTDNNNYTPGYITEVSIHDKVLSQAEATWMYNAGVPRDLRLLTAPSQIRGWWRLGAAMDIPWAARWETKIQQWVPDPSTKETATITNASYLQGDGTLYNMVAGDVTTDTPGGISEYSCTFDGVNKGMYCSSFTAPYNFIAGECFSSAGWVKLGALGVSGWLWGTGTNASNWVGWGVFLVSGKLRFCMTNGYTGSAKILEEVNAAIGDTGWHHVAVAAYYDTQSASKYNITIYVDGVAQASTRLDNDNSGMSGTGFSVGARGTSQYDPVNASIDEVAVFTKPLTQDDVTTMWNGGAPTDLRDHKLIYPHIKGWWRMGDSYPMPGDHVNMEYSDRRPFAPGTNRGYSTNGMYFNSNDYVDCGDPSELNFDYNDAFSISAWVVPWGIEVGTRCLVSKQVSNYASCGWQLGMYTYNTSDDPESHMRVVFCSATGTGGGFFEVYPGSRQRPLVCTEWMHVVMTYDGSNTAEGISFYINGVKWPTYVRYDTAFTQTMTTTTPFKIGTVNYTGSYWQGYEDEFSAWDKELSQADVTAIYNDGDPTDLSLHAAVANLVGWWRLGEGAPVDATMTNMESGDIQNTAPGMILQAEAALVGDASVTALGGYLLQTDAALEGDSAMTGELLGDLEVAADLAGDSSFSGAVEVNYGAAAVAEGSSEVVATAIVRVPVSEHIYGGPLRTTEQAQRLAGYQPDRKPVVKKPTFGIGVKR